VTFGGNYVDESNKDAFAGCWREYVAARKLAASGGFTVLLPAPLPIGPRSFRRPSTSRALFLPTAPLYLDKGAVLTLLHGAGITRIENGGL
jgi:hypothetical protein